MLTVDRLRVHLGGRPVLQDVSFSVPPGQLTAVLGLNGAGKTTLLKAILGFCPKVDGVLSAGGQNLERLSPSRRAQVLSYVPQHYEGSFRGPVQEFVSMGVTAYLGLFSQPGPDSLRQAQEILEQLDCGHLCRRPMERLSGGERKMAYLARAILQDSSYLLLDEPVSSLDFSRQHLFLDCLRRYVAQRQAGCLLTIHSPELAYAYAGRILILHAGRLLLDTARSDQDFDAALCSGLRQIYGPSAQARIQEGGLTLRWEPDRPG